VRKGKVTLKRNVGVVKKWWSAGALACDEKLRIEKA
jgi:hypothetical protein